MEITLLVSYVKAYSEERYLTNGQPDICKMNPFVLTMQQRLPPGGKAELFAVDGCHGRVAEGRAAALGR